MKRDPFPDLLAYDPSGTPVSGAGVEGIRTEGKH